MAYQSIFKRYELKYLLTRSQQAQILELLRHYMVQDRYGNTTIRNLYFDTPDYRLIRHSMEKPVYKEKLRLRSYQKPGASDPVFVEIKKKYKSVVYKRRLSLPQQQALRWLAGHREDAPDCQIGREIDYFLSFYPQLHPTVFLSYDRQAWVCEGGFDLRVTFDENILCRQESLSLQEDPWGSGILPEDRVLMEIKTGSGIPLWLTNTLTRERIFKTSFSKYGTAYANLIFPKIKGDITYVEPAFQRYF